MTTTALTAFLITWAIVASLIAIGAVKNSLDLTRKINDWREAMEQHDRVVWRHNAVMNDRESIILALAGRFCELDWKSLAAICHTNQTCEMFTEAVNGLKREGFLVQTQDGCFHAKDLPPFEAKVSAQPQEELQFCALFE